MWSKNQNIVNNCGDLKIRKDEQWKFCVFEWMMGSKNQKNNLVIIRKVGQWKIVFSVEKCGQKYFVVMPKNGL